jgi:hypothetical protein
LHRADHRRGRLSIVAKLGDDVRLDGTAVTGWITFGMGLITTAAPLSVGTHTVSCRSNAASTYTRS